MPILFLLLFLIKVLDLLSVTKFDEKGGRGGGKRGSQRGNRVALTGFDAVLVVVVVRKRRRRGVLSRAFSRC